jgi:hypothetical protein
MRIAAFLKLEAVSCEGSRLIRRKENPVATLAKFVISVIVFLLFAYLFLVLAYGFLVAIYQLSVVSAVFFLVQVVVLFAKKGPDLALLIAAGLNTIIDTAFGIAAQQYAQSLVIGSVTDLLVGLAGLAIIYYARDQIKDSINKSLR